MLSDGGAVADSTTEGPAAFSSQISKDAPCVSAAEPISRLDSEQAADHGLTAEAASQRSCDLALALAYINGTMCPLHKFQILLAAVLLES